MLVALDKGKPAAKRGRKAYGPLLEEAAGLPKGASVDNSARSGEKQADAAGELSELAQLASERTPETIERALAAAKEGLGMDVAFVSECADSRLIFR